MRGVRVHERAIGWSADALKVVTTTTILADLVRQVGGDRVSVESLVPKGGEVHTFDPTPSDVRNVAEADLVFVNGLGLDDWLVELVANAGTDAPVVRLAEDLEGVTYLKGTEGDEAVNPHLWLNVAYAAKYAERIREALVAADPDHAADYEAGGAAYAKVLADLDAEARTTLGAIPAANRTVISFHDAFPYFAAAYGLTVDGTIVDAPGPGPERRPGRGPRHGHQGQGDQGDLRRGPVQRGPRPDHRGRDGGHRRLGPLHGQRGRRPAGHLRGDDGLEHRAGGAGARGRADPEIRRRDPDVPPGQEDHRPLAG